MKRVKTFFGPFMLAYRLIYQNVLFLTNTHLQTRPTWNFFFGIDVFGVNESLGKSEGKGM